jgi:exopolyphosphatase/guanosine-5'-triphosphate,3'-diphosphate pyrophosphatase
MDRSIDDQAMTVAAIDAGTNTVLMLIARSDNGSLSILEDSHSIVRLGEGLEKNGYINEDAYHRLYETMKSYRSLIDKYHCGIITAKGTSALRSAANAADIIERIRSAFDITIEPITGSEEARLTYLGAAYDLKSDLPAAVIDIGGGSTEIGFGLGSNYISGISLDIGAVRMKERGMSDETVEAIRSSLSIVQPRSIQTLIAVAGTPTSLAAITLGLEKFEKDRVNGTVLTAEQIESLLNRLSRLSAIEIQEHYPVIPQGRADILPFGTLILLEAMNHLQINTVTVSTRGLRYGIAFDALMKR